MFFYIIAGTFLLDQTTKTVVQFLMYQGESIPVLPPVFYLTYIMNPGAAFGFLAYQTHVFIIISVVLIAGMLLGYRKLPPGRGLLRTGMGMIVGGALGNLADRLRYGLVVDFLDFRVWPVFNVADTAIVIGTGFLIWEILMDKGPKEKQESEN
jgi:signal peptidase II